MCYQVTSQVKLLYIYLPTSSPTTYISPPLYPPLYISPPLDFKFTWNTRLILNIYRCLKIELNSVGIRFLSWHLFCSPSTVFELTPLIDCSTNCLALYPVPKTTLAHVIDWLVFNTNFSSISAISWPDTSAIYIYIYIHTFQIKVIIGALLTTKSTRITSRTHQIWCWWSWECKYWWWTSYSGRHQTR
jgi:hypothetical protein